MKFRNITFLVTLYASIGLEAQTFQWAKSFGSTGDDVGQDIAVDGDGNVYSAGGFLATVDFDPGINTFNLTSDGGVDIFISKFDKEGNFLWAKKIGSSRSESPFSIALDNNGNIYATGQFGSRLDFNPGIDTFFLTATLDDIFVLKLDSDGNFVWAQKLGGTSFDYGFSIALDHSGNVYSTGLFQGTADFDPGIGIFNLTAERSPDIFISKLDPDGHFVWAKRVGGEKIDKGQSITVDQSGVAYLTGLFEGTVDFDPDVGVHNLGSTDSSDAFVLKLDANGNFVWAKIFGGQGYDGGGSIKLGANNDLYIMGLFEGKVDFDPGAEIYNLTSQGGYDIFLTKLDTNGKFNWAKKIGGTNNDLGNITVDYIGNIYSAGRYEGTVDFNPGNGTYNLISNGSRDIFISKFDSNGNFIWAKSMGGKGEDEASSIIAANGYVYVTGIFESAVDFNPPSGSKLISNGFYDIFIAKYNSDVTGLPEEYFEPLFTIYPNPTKSYFNIDLGEQSMLTEVIIRNALNQEIDKKMFYNTSLLNLKIEGENGIYFLFVKAENKMGIYKVLKEY